MPSRYEFERAVRASSLPPLSRLLALTIATWANADTGKIPTRYQPSLSTLLEATGMAKGTLLTHRTRLSKDKWITFKSPSVADQRSLKARCTYTLHVPAGSGADLVTGSGDDLELGQELTQTNQAVGQELTQHWVSSRPSTRSGADHKSSLSTAEYQQSKQEEPAADAGIPADARDLVDGLTAAGISVRWPFKGTEWFPILALIKKSGTPALIEQARKAAARTSVESAKYFVRGWTELPPLPSADTPRPALKAVVGGYQPWTNPNDHSDYENGF